MSDQPEAADARAFSGTRADVDPNRKMIIRNLNLTRTQMLCGSIGFFLVVFCSLLDNIGCGRGVIKRFV